MAVSFYFNVLYIFILGFSPFFLSHSCILALTPFLSLSLFKQNDVYYGNIESFLWEWDVNFVSQRLCLWSSLSFFFIAETKLPRCKHTYTHKAARTWRLLLSNDMATAVTLIAKFNKYFMLNHEIFIWNFYIYLYIFTSLLHYRLFIWEFIKYYFIFSKNYTFPKVPSTFFSLSFFCIFLLLVVGTRK